MNRKPARVHAMDGAAFPHIIKVKYTIDGKDYICRKFGMSLSTKNFPVMNGLQNSFSKSKIHTILSVGVLLYRPAFLLKVLPWKNVSRVFCDRCNFKKGADFSVKAW